MTGTTTEGPAQVSPPIETVPPPPPPPPGPTGARPAWLIVSAALAAVGLALGAFGVVRLVSAQGVREEASGVADRVASLRAEVADLETQRASIETEAEELTASIEAIGSAPGDLNAALRAYVDLAEEAVSDQKAMVAAMENAIVAAEAGNRAEVARIVDQQVRPLVESYRATLAAQREALGTVREALASLQGAMP